MYLFVYDHTVSALCICSDRSGCINLVSLWNKDIESQYEDQINEQKRQYSSRLVTQLNYRTPKMLAVITLRFKQRDLSIEKFVQKLHIEWQTV